LTIHKAWAVTNEKIAVFAAEFVLSKRRALYRSMIDPSPVSSMVAAFARVFFDTTQGMRSRALLGVLGSVVVFSGFLAYKTAHGVAAADEAPSGMVWERHGEWHLNGSPAVLRLGEAMPPGGLLTAGAESPSHSMTVLLPDGQRMLCECYEAKSCSQGFRVPAITPRPSPAVWEMFVAVRNVLLLRPASAEAPFTTPTGRAAKAGNVEMVAAMTPQGEVSIAPALRVLPSGQYSLSVANDGSQAPAASRPTTQPLSWTAGQKAAPVRLPEPGVYRIRVTDQTYVPRLEIEVLTATSDSLAAEAAGLKQVRETIMGWNQTRGGWSMHDFLRVYLQARGKENR
jgi:hypothetical protein